MSGIPLKKLSVEDQIRVYRDLFREKPVKVKVDPGSDTLEDKLKQKEAIEKKHRIRRNIARGVFVGSFLVFFSPIFFAMNDDKFAPYRKDTIVVEYLDKKQQVRYLEYEKEKIVRNTEYTLEKVLGETAKNDRILNLQKAINMLQNDIKEKEGKKEVAAYNSFLNKAPPYLVIPGLLIGGLGFFGSFKYLDKNNKNKVKELKALGF